MTPSSPQSLLRRTSLALAALAAAWLVTTPASANTITLGGASAGENCSYNGMTVDPSGNVTVSCAGQATGGNIGTGGSTPPPSGGVATAYISGAPAQMPLSSSITPWVPTNVFVTLTTTQTTDTTVNYNISGSGCYMNGIQPPGSGAVTIPAGQTLSPAIGLMATSAGTICSLGLTSISPSSNATMTGVTGGAQPSHVDIPVSLTLGGGSSGGGGTPPPSGTGGAVPTVVGCPTPQSGTAVLGVLPSTQGAHMANDGTTNGFWIEPTGVITAVALPTLPSGTAAGVLSLTYGVFSAQDPQNYEIQISKCPGVIDPNVPVGGSGSGTQNLGGQTVPGYCYYTSTNPNLVALGWYARPSTSPARSLSQLALGGNCVADESQGTWYANIRYTYTNCAQAGTNKCGEQIQWNNNGP